MQPEMKCFARTVLQVLFFSMYNINLLTQNVLSLFSERRFTSQIKIFKTH